MASLFTFAATVDAAAYNPVASPKNSAATKHQLPASTPTQQPPAFRPTVRDCAGSTHHVQPKVCQLCHGQLPACAPSPPSPCGLQQQDVLQLEVPVYDQGVEAVQVSHCCRDVAGPCEGVCVAVAAGMGLGHNLGHVLLQGAALQ